MSVLHHRVLLLNSCYEPLGMIGVMRALVLHHKKKIRYEVVDKEYLVHSPTATYSVPSVVVQTTEYVNVRKRREATGKQRTRIFIRDRYKCQYCGVKFQPQDLTLDHILPRSKNGGDKAENLATSCKPCNQRKGNRTPDEARMTLLASPSALRYGLDKAALLHEAERHPEWLPYLYQDAIEDVA